MTRRLSCLCLVVLLCFPGGDATSADRPNFLWILSEDNSKHYLKLFDADGAEAPNIERLAREGLAFDHAFSNAPVCSVARTTLMTGMLAPRVGFQFHRKEKLANLPAGVEMWPVYLRRTGYYTSNNSKKDYNVVEGQVWDESSRRATWKNRPTVDTPFFHMQSWAQSHESSLHFTRAQQAAEILATDPATIQLAPSHPDTPLFRHTHARYLDRMGIIDGIVGEMVSELEAAGLLEDTFVFYFGDHGGVLPRSKGYLYESGLHVPLVVRIPKNWAHLVSFKRGARPQGFVSFIDFGPTLLRLAGVSVPDVLDGRPFLGPKVTAESVNGRDEAFGYADRFDEKCDLVRSLRKGHFKYLRNYQAFYPDALQNNYRYKMLAYEEWRTLYRMGQLNAVQRQFFEPRAPEQLFDLRTDPWEVNNLADNPKYRQILLDLRQRLRRRVEAIHDLSFYPENHLLDHALEDGVAFGEAHARQINRLIDIADLALRNFAEAKAPIADALESPDEWERYWGLIVCSVFGERAGSLVANARTRLTDSQPLARLRAAEFLGSLHAMNPMPVVYDVLNASRSSTELLLGFNTAVYLRDQPRGYPFDVHRLDLQLTKGEFVSRIEYLRLP